jgi:hypothetical protein
MRTLCRAFIFTFLLCTSLHAYGSDVQWTDYQKKILLEQPNFTGWCPVEKAKHIMNILYSHPSEVCVELGVYGGSSFFPLASTLAYKQQGIAYATDPWDNLPCLEGNEQDEKQKSYWGKIDLNIIMHKFIEGMHTHGLDANYVILRMSSQQALSYFEAESIDFLHIDGNHSEQVSVFDVTHWLPKVKKGGVICFDDAWWDSTQKAVRLLLQECDIMKESSPKWQYIFVKKRG